MTGGGGAAAAMVAADMDEGAGEGWGEDAALVIDEGAVFILNSILLLSMAVVEFHVYCFAFGDHRRRIW